MVTELATKHDDVRATLHNMEAVEAAAAG
jgi:hypothetical protein